MILIVYFNYIIEFHVKDKDNFIINQLYLFVNL